MAHRAPEAIGLARFQSLRVDVIAVRVVPVALHDGKPGAGQHDVLGHVAFGLDGAFQLAVRSVDEYVLYAVCIYQSASGFKFAEHAPFLHEFQPGEVYFSQQLAVVGAQLQNGQALALADAFEPDTLFGCGDLLYFGEAGEIKERFEQRTVPAAEGPVGHGVELAAADVGNASEEVRSHGLRDHARHGSLRLLRRSGRRIRAGPAAGRQCQQHAEQDDERFFHVAASPRFCPYDGGSSKFVPAQEPQKAPPAGGALAYFPSSSAARSMYSS